ncbi:hypothetical protein ACO03V_06035 [Microbacterium sp. HMH0099]|uniref:hypothetical protein n=1 Tax=Microbacterium sp. HMH0099 TaxID=3414026 RepID=UPI003BF63EED
MSSPEKGPVARFVSAAWAVLLACILLWAAVWIFQQIVWWLIGLAAAAIIIWFAVLVVRWRRDRWLR